ncbi:glycosyltransferase family 4 protein [Algibacter sp. L4_22]|uniref:glycosyltransferase family 4 protein n=1 Tax=Algibacter sp. L4_22 TaxID=2942477 RepID=UPI00201B8B5E|nr:glycosyltransferase family 4 protein [Algibacter sp. L4_22]MCL5128755.1 glycosyltransferase family 4 protein [Algibacter sp. L4_22]
MKHKLVVIPSDPIQAYEEKGTSSWLEEYYNPNSFFDEVYVLSPLEKEARDVYGLKIIPCKNPEEYKRHLKSINPLCVRAYGGYWATTYANYNRVANIPVVSSVHDTNVKLLHESLKFSDEVFTMSTVINKVLVKELNIKNAKVLGNRVDTAKFNKLEESSNPLAEQFKNKKVILHIGRKSFEKNIETVVKSLVFLEDDYVLVLIGKGDVQSYITIAKEHKVEDRLHVIEKVENEALVKWYNIAKVLCVPSRWEGFGLVFAEAASCKTKIVTSNIAPMNAYLLNDKVMNILVDKYEDPKIIAQAILELANSNLSNNDTRDLIIKNFDKKIIAEREVGYYKSVSYQKKNIDYKIWYIKYYYNKDFKHKVKRVIKLPKRIWKKLLSYL